EDRYASAAELADVLERFARPARRPLWAAAAGVAILAVALGAVFARPWHRPAAVAPVVPAATTPQATLRVGVWNTNEKRYNDLPGAAVATGSRIRVEAEVPAGVHAALYYLDSAGVVETLGTSEPSGEPATLRFPTDPK